MDKTTTLTIEQLQNQIEEQNQQIALQNQQIAELTLKLKWYEERLLLNQKKRFGSSSEKTDEAQLTLPLFNEAEETADPAAEEPTLETITYSRHKQSGKREKELKDLPVEVIEYHLPENEQTCSSCGNPLHEMSVEVRQELKVIPAQVKVVKHVRHVYACRHCEHHEAHTPIVTAPMPTPVFPGSLASPSAMAYIMSQKYVYAQPLYRQEKHLERLGVPLSRQTLANWMLYGAHQWLHPLYERMKEHLIRQEILHADETTVQVLREENRAAETTSYMWLYRTGRDGPPIILFDYQKTRAGEHPKAFLAGFRGFLHVDGYAGYNQLKPEVTLVGCFAHARRKFDEALNALPPSDRNKNVAAKIGLGFCNQLYAVERDLKEASPEERYEERLKRSKPILEAFSVWLHQMKDQVLPKSTFGQAVQYCLNQWESLTNYLKDGRLEIDNNRSERSIKPFVIGRKNWLFSNTPRGAKASAIIYSIIETAKENNLNPYNYLTYLFERLPNIDLKDKDMIDQLLPWSAALPSNCRVNQK
ncbi:IS66 family transposase [Thermicanus aegyptius]|uniref:IS66 family transposase n=2 Tax=Thermicanus aegyptius TaxID=94009 RepID=UPI00058734B1|nr:IS66 family transposase [Thermicanus aegyptius]